MLEASTDPSSLHHGVRLPHARTDHQTMLDERRAFEQFDPQAIDSVHDQPSMIKGIDSVHEAMARFGPSYNFGLPRAPSNLSLEPDYVRSQKAERQAEQRRRASMATARQEGEAPGEVVARDKNGRVVARGTPGAPPQGRRQVKDFVHDGYDVRDFVRTGRTVDQMESPGSHDWEREILRLQASPSDYAAFRDVMEGRVPAYTVLNDQKIHPEIRRRLSEAYEAQDPIHERLQRARERQIGPARDNPIRKKRPEDVQREREEADREVEFNKQRKRKIESREQMKAARRRSIRSNIGPQGRLTGAEYNKNRRRSSSDPRASQHARRMEMLRAMGMTG